MSNEIGSNSEQEEKIQQDENELVSQDILEVQRLFGEMKRMQREFFDSTTKELIRLQRKQDELFGRLSKYLLIKPYIFHETDMSTTSFEGEPVSATDEVSSFSADECIEERHALPFTLRKFRSGEVPSSSVEGKVMEARKEATDRSAELLRRQLETRPISRRYIDSVNIQKPVPVLPRRQDTQVTSLPSNSSVQPVHFTFCAYADRTSLECLEPECKVLQVPTNELPKTNQLIYLGNASTAADLITNKEETVARQTSQQQVPETPQFLGCRDQISTFSGFDDEDPEKFFEELEHHAAGLPGNHLCWLTRKQLRNEAAKIPQMLGLVDYLSLKRTIIEFFCSKQRMAQILDRFLKRNQDPQELAGVFVTVQWRIAKRLFPTDSWEELARKILKKLEPEVQKHMSFYTYRDIREFAHIAQYSQDRVRAMYREQ